MPLGYKYVERDADSQINWAEVGKSLSDVLLETKRVREEKKDVITTSGGDSGPGANAAFQSPIGDRYSNRGSISEGVSSNAVAANSAQRQNPFTNYYGMDLSGVGGYYNT